MNRISRRWRLLYMTPRSIAMQEEDEAALGCMWKAPGCVGQHRRLLQFIATLIGATPHNIPGRLHWLVVRQWVWRYHRLMVRLSPCIEHDPVSVQFGRLADFESGTATLQSRCRRCGYVLRAYPA